MKSQFAKKLIGYVLLMRYPLMLVGVFIASLFLASSILMKDVSSVIISDGNSLYELTAKCDTVGEALSLAGFDLNDDYMLNCELSDTLASVDYIEISRPVTVDVVVDNEKQTLVTYSDTISDVLEENGIQLDSNDVIEVETPVSTDVVEKEETALEDADEIDEVEVDADAAEDNAAEDETESETETVESSAEIEAETVVSVVRVETTYHYDYETLYYDIEYVEDSSMYTGESKVITPGSEGEKVYTFRVTLEDGVEVSREFVGEEVTVEPVNEVVAYGTKAAMTTSRGQVAYSEVLSVNATAYTNDSEWGDLLHSTGSLGLRARWGIIAVDPSVIPIGTKVYVKSTDGSADYGFAIAADTGGAIIGNKIDLWMDSESTCNSWGIRSVEVYILDDQSSDVFELRNGSVWP